MNTFDKFESRTLIQATLEIETGLSVGSRVSLEPIGTDLPVMKTVDGFPFIPGSSLKGVVRAQMERILRSINHRPALWACDPFAEPCSSAISKEESTDERVFTQTVWDASCTVCRLFGSPLFASRLFFKDAPLINADVLPVLTQIRDGVGIDRDLGAARTGAKYDFETVVPGSRFGIEVLAENADEWEIGLVLTVLRILQEGHLAIGGKSTRGPGWGRLQHLTVRRVNRQALLAYLIQGEISEVETGKFLEVFQQKIQSEGESYA